MRLESDFETLDTYMAVYGEHSFSNNTLKVYLAEGLGVTPDLRVFFPKNYFYDPWSRAKYSEVDMVDGGLAARLESSGEWVKYKDKTISEQVLKYEYVGGCWFVFDGVVFSRQIVDEYAADRQGSSGRKIAQEIGDFSLVDQRLQEFVLEGVLDVFPGPGWVSWAIFASSFHIEIAD
jgi:hypothetical protein